MGWSMELARLCLGLIVAVILPLDLPVFRRNYAIAAGFTFIYSAYATFPVLDTWKSLVICLAAVLAGAAIISTVRLRSGVLQNENPAQDPGSRYQGRPYNWRQISQIIRRTASGGSVGVVATLGLIVVLAFAVGALYGTGLTDRVRHVWLDDSAAVILSGFLIAMFTVNHLVYLTVRPLIKELQSEGENLLLLIPNSEFIGWIERGLVFIFVAGGQSDAAAIAIAVKSLARLPNVGNHEKGFTEYFLVGTLASLMAAVALAVIVRISLGLSPL
jgi:hypothetical protein